MKNKTRSNGDLIVLEASTPRGQVWCAIGAPHLAFHAKATIRDRLITVPIRPVHSTRRLLRLPRALALAGRMEDTLRHHSWATTQSPPSDHPATEARPRTEAEKLG